VSEVDGTLPQGWTWSTVEELAAPEPNAITDGPFGSNLKTSHYVADGPRVIRLQNVGEGNFTDARAHIAPEHFARLTKHRVYANDIVIAALGEKLPRACIVPANVGPAIVKADCIRFRPDERVALSQFLNWMLNAEPTQRQVGSSVHGVGRPRLNLTEIKAIRLPLPPIAEQRRIVAAIEEQFTRLDAAVVSLQRARANLKRYRAAVLKAAVEGRLVRTEAEMARAECRSYETGEQLLARILAERRAWWMAEHGSKKPYREPKFPDLARLPTLPEGWVWATVEHLGALGEQAVMTGPFGTSLGTEDFTDSGIPVLTIGCLADSGIRLSKAMYVRESKASSLSRYGLQTGDLLFSRMASVGRAGFVTSALEGALFNYHIMRLRLHAEALLPGLLLCLCAWVVGC
jgi:type I restriction enzyme, S subunit